MSASGWARRALGVEPVAGSFVHEGEVLRHDYEAVAKAVMELALARRNPKGSRA